MKSKVIAILETRTGAHLGDLIARRGGIPMLAPALEEIPDVVPQTVVSLLEAWRRTPFDMVIFQTGVGTRALFQTTDSLGSTDELLRLLGRAVVVVRGPKPIGELTARRVRIDLRASSPFTTETVLEAIAGISLKRAAVLVQRYGATNERLRDSLQARGARVEEIATYRWALPADTRPARGIASCLGCLARRCGRVYQRRPSPEFVCSGRSFGQRERTRRATEWVRHCLDRTGMLAGA